MGDRSRFLLSFTILLFLAYLITRQEVPHGVLTPSIRRPLLSPSPSPLIREGLMQMLEEEAEKEAYRKSLVAARAGAAAVRLSLTLETRREEERQEQQPMEPPVEQYEEVSEDPPEEPPEEPPLEQREKIYEDKWEPLYPPALAPLDPVVIPRHDPPRRKPYPENIKTITDPVEFTHQFQPTVHCSTEERTSQGLDGGKWSCHPRVLLTQPGDRCVVYSFGSRGEFAFEEEILKLGPTCEIHTFDPTPGLKERLADGGKVPKGIVTHFDYGLGAEGIAMAKVGSLMTLDEVASLLGHEFLHILKIDVEGSEEPRRFVNTSEGSIWRRTALLQFEIHPHHPKKSWWRLMDDLAKVGFELYHFEVNMIHPMLTELSFLNPKVMQRYLEIPYTQEQLLQARRESLERVARSEPFGNFTFLSGTYGQVEQSHFGCRLLKLIPGQLSRSFCETFLTEDVKEIGLRSSLFIFEDGLSWSEFDNEWLKSFQEAYNLRVHRWTGSKQVVTSSCPAGMICHLLPHMNGNVTTPLSWEATVRVAEGKGTLQVSEEVDLGMVLIRFGDSIASTLALLHEPAFLDTVMAKPRLQLVIDTDLCSGQAEGIRMLFQRLRELEFHLLEKSLDMERSVVGGGEKLKKGLACFVVLTFSR